jgi:hypothetical protein
MHEILTEERGFTIAYTTLARAVRCLDLEGNTLNHAGRFPDVAGQEMQHDTTIYTVVINGMPAKVVCSCLYLRYSKLRFIKFYRWFNRFQMKCFIDEALRFWGCCALACIIDNTSLVILSGSGADALFVPEMVAFANGYGFHWVAHAIGHADRKAGVERNFWAVETNFLPGRTFVSFEDLNVQAFEWATQRYAWRPQSHTGLVPAKLFEHEKNSLRKLPDFISPPSQTHKRVLDAYGYIRFDGNFYWAPLKPGFLVTIVQYSDHVVLYEKPDVEIARYSLPPLGTKGKTFAPPDKPGKRDEPRNLRKGCEIQEKHLRQKGTLVSSYIDFIKSAACAVRYKPQFIRDLYDIAQTCSEELFLALISRALRYRVSSTTALLRMAVLITRARNHDSQASVLPAEPAREEYQQRQTYRDGEFSTEHDHSAILDNPTSEKEHNDHGSNPPRSPEFPGTAQPV